MKNSILIFFLTLLLIFTLNSCGIKDYLDTDEFKVKASPEMVVPLAYGNLNVDKLINSIQSTDSLFGKRPNGDVTMTYEKKNFFDYAVKDLIKFENNIDMGAFNFDFGSANIDFSLDYKITLGDLLKNLGGDIQELSAADGTKRSFPAYEFLGNPPTDFKVDQINDFEQVTFSSGKLVVELTNHLPVFGIFFDFELFDNLSGKTIGSFAFGNKDRYPGYDIYYSDDYFAGEKFGLPGSLCMAGGSLGAATERIETDLTGVSFSNQLSIKLKRFYTDGSGGIKPLINYKDGLDFSLKFENTKVESGRFKVPSQTLAEKTDKIGNLELTDGVKVHKVKINSGSLEFVLSKTLPVTGIIHLTFPSITKANGSKLSVDMPFDLKNSYTYNVDLTNVTIDFTENAQNPFNTLYYSYSVDVNQSDFLISFKSTDNFNFVINLKDININSAEGDFGQKNIAIDPATLNVFPENLNKIDGNMYFLDPTIRLIVHNAVSAPVQVVMNMDGANRTGQTAKLNPKPFILPYPDYPLQTDITGTVEFNKSNSDIVKFLSLPPTKSISYNGNIQLNPNGAPAFNDLNYIRTNSKISFDLEVEIPVAFDSLDVIMTDTIAFSGNNLKNIVSGELIVKADNGIPLGIDLELNFIDSLVGTIYGTPVKAMLLDAAKVDDTGTVTGHTVATHSVVLSEAQLPQYRKANAILVKATVYSPEKGSKPAKLNGSNDLVINVGLKAKIDLNN